MGFETFRDNTAPLGDLVRVLTLIMSPPNHRSEPLAGDRQDRHFDAWFDGGAIVMPTGGASEYYFDDHVHAVWAGLAPRLSLSVSWPDGRAVTIQQHADHVDFAKDDAVTRSRSTRPEPWYCTYCGAGPMPLSDGACLSCHEARLVKEESLTHFKCSTCGAWNVGSANYCEGCGIKLIRPTGIPGSSESRSE